MARLKPVVIAFGGLTKHPLRPDIANDLDDSPHQLEFWHQPAVAVALEETHVLHPAQVGGGALLALADPRHGFGIRIRSAALLAAGEVGLGDRDAV